jgi:hypothetical protein
LIQKNTSLSLTLAPFASFRSKLSIFKELDVDMFYN